MDKHLSIFFGLLADLIFMENNCKVKAEIETKQ
jgi:hypothetical protein